MKTLTTQQRNRIYKKAYEKIYHFDRFISGHLIDECIHRDIDTPFDEVFPEYDLIYGKGYTKAERLTALGLMIAMTEQ